MGTSRPENRLLIGEAAQLVGTTPKAIRHYEKLGLLKEPERSESGYRLYTASDLLHLSRIKKLQHLGLSLERIRGVLGGAGSEVEFQSVLQTLLGEVESQIDHLQKRRDNLQGMLAEEATADQGVSALEKEPYMFVLLRESLGGRFEDLDPRMLEQMKGLWSTLDSFQWPEGYTDFQEGLARYIVDHPSECEKLLALEERLAALAQAPESAPEVEQLARDYAAFYEESALLDGIFRHGGKVDQPIGGMEAVLSGVAMSSVSPAQRRCLELLVDHLSRRSPGESS